MIITNENLFLIILGLVWIIGAVLQDLHRREVDNLWNFSLIGFALAYRAAVSVFSSDYWFVLNGLIGFGIFLVLGNLFYYSRLFAGGDAKLLIAFGTILPLSFDWFVNLRIFVVFISLFLLGGSIYALFYSFVLMSANWKRFKIEFSSEFRDNFKFFIIFLIIVIVWVNLMFFVGQKELILIGLVILLFPILFIFSKAIEESCLIKKVSPSELTVGDWLYKDVKVGNKIIKSNWEGVSAAELNLIRKKHKGKVFVKQGIPFTPGFLIGFVGLLLISRAGLFGL